MDNQIDDNSVNTNSIFQRVILGVASLYFAVDSFNVILDYRNGVDNYRMVDGIGDGMKLMAFLVVIGICLFTIDRRTSKRNFVAILILGIGILLNVSSHGIGKFIATLSLTLGFMLYLIITGILDWRKSQTQ